MTRPIAVVDTGPIVLLLENVPGDAERIRRRMANEQNLLEFAKRARLVVPTPVIAELGRDGSGLAVVRDSFVRRLARVRTEPLTLEAADIASQMRQHMLSIRSRGEERGAVTYDALIAAIAHAIGARWLLTTNRSHMQTCLIAVQSTVAVVETTELPRGTQLPLGHVSLISSTEPMEP